MPLMDLQYLTVQDVLWINLQVTGAPQPFQYADLEEATFYQYGYGQSSNLANQAARLLNGFSKKQPFQIGNEATGLVATAAFLLVNGWEYRGDDLTAWYKQIKSGAHEALASIQQDFEEVHRHHPMEVREAISAVLDRNPDLREKLAGSTV